MRSLGDKISSTIVAQHADVPCMPWSGTGITDTIMSEHGFLTVSDDVYQKACIHSSEEGLEKAQTIGFPVMIKASEGGGGKGKLLFCHACRCAAVLMRKSCLLLQVSACVAPRRISGSCTTPCSVKCLVSFRVLFPA